ncbi:putative tRNA N6-adenosine threonylcarbamoyltransferase, mitochondrial [Smittium mucronatum]|uniref:N(6)-L-threonylcarbamoyladenine synthase n=1 Tax=Smittium mucronatum TaxID=133383 RepID=A0A1R0GX85_9FUNG|nr:putative tRNA N6-adenosine threonylcarbamoyltransferase, mitochondrial [Smittium mucronatum]
MMRKYPRVIHCLFGKSINLPNATALSRFYSLKANEFAILGIESSCDDTAAAVVTSTGRILSNVIRNQHKVHAKYGGIVPILAAEQHTMNMPYVISEALEQANLAVPDLAAIAVTRGPGMPGSLGVCLNAAKTLAAVFKKPLIGVHHMEAHALVARINTDNNIQFPFLSFLLSGGHTMLLVAHSVNRYSCLGTTLDDSIGEVFDKVSRQIDIPSIKDQLDSYSFYSKSQYQNHSAGEALELLASFGDERKYSLPLPMNKSDTSSSLNYSFSGLKSAAFRLISSISESESESESDLAKLFKSKADVAASFQYTATKHLISKLVKSLFYTRSQLGIFPKSIVVSGGVASNKYINGKLREFAHSNKMEYFSPPIHLCTDNGVMIAWAGVERFKLGLTDPYSITFKQRWPLEELGSPLA